MKISKDFTVREYLEQEDKSSSKHEFHNGEILAMSGGTYQHGIIGGNCNAALNNALRSGGKNCTATNSEVRIYIDEVNNYLYPDAMVVCGEAKFSEQDKNSVVNPVLIVEVLSKSTKNYDRGEKFEKYRLLASFREYVLVYQTEPVVEVFTRQADGSWHMVTVIGLEEVVVLHSIDCQVKMSDIYYRVPDLKEPTFRLFKEE